MALEQFTLDALAKMDNGKISTLFERHMQRCADDCDDRPSDKTARKVMIIVTLEPIKDGEDCAGVNVQVSLENKVPVHRTRPYNMGIRKGRKGTMIVYNEDAPDNHNQSTMDLKDEDL